MERDPSRETVEERAHRLRLPGFFLSQVVWTERLERLAHITPPEVPEQLQLPETEP